MTPDKSKVKIRTAVGETDYLEFSETVKKGSMLGPACIWITVHIDDVSNGCWRGDPMDIVVMAEKLRLMEDQKKFSFVV